MRTSLMKKFTTVLGTRGRLRSRQLAASSVIGGNCGTWIWQVNDAARCYGFRQESHAGRTSHVDQARRSESSYRNFRRLVRGGTCFRPVLSEPADQAGSAFPGGRSNRRRGPV